ncbi:MAG: 4Fe-4S dicluster domain-containing protein [Alphaproteobacteria bacterium]|nr:4Fe-4S dicluster domain-containing protein [Alphaproteobacteria bacterium]
MDKLSPVYTLDNECQDCYKCIRRCPVKAIKIQDGRARVLPNRCIACGKCVAPCPSSAKRVRSDIAAVKDLLSQNRKVYISLAPSWRAAFSCALPSLIAALKKLGFAGVSETALGAQEVSIKTAELLNQASAGLFISSACPVIVDYIHLYRPEMSRYIVPLASPAQTHAKLLKQTYGEDIKVVFIGPCIAKKAEADHNPELLSAALTFDEIDFWLKEAEIDITDEQNEAVVPTPANEGALYPLDGGMNETLKLVGLKDDVQLTQVSSLHLFFATLDSVEAEKLTSPLFIEALACAGGCINGPCMSGKNALFNDVADIMKNVSYRQNIPHKPQVVAPLVFKRPAVAKPTYTVAEISEALKRIGKYTPEDEINCAGCGYQTCRGLARALLSGDAEPSMCVSYMRALANKKVSAMLKSMPASMFMLDKDLRILEANEAFIKEFTGDMCDDFLRDASLLSSHPISHFLPWGNMFGKVLTSGVEVHKDSYKFAGKYYDVHIFPIEKGESVGAIISDLSIARGNHEFVAKQAKEVINKNIATVQKIAMLLGEHMVETESILSAIADDYGAPEEEEGK